MRDNDLAEKLLSRLRRIAMSVRLATPLEDRRRLLCLEADLRSVRDNLRQRSALLGAQMNAVGAQLNAVSAYARCASLQRNPSHLSK
jgi:hypothetical protein